VRVSFRLLLGERESSFAPRHHIARPWRFNDSTAATKRRKTK
jgi:hypothetical protein